MIVVFVDNAVHTKKLLHNDIPFCRCSKLSPAVTVKTQVTSGSGEFVSACTFAERNEKKTRADHADEPEMNVHFATNFLFANPRRKKYFLVSGCDLRVLRDIYNIQD